VPLFRDPSYSPDIAWGDSEDFQMASVLLTLRAMRVDTPKANLFLSDIPGGDPIRLRRDKGDSWMR
jgi:hypothetical protein